MLITINCPSCGREIRNIEEDWRGQRSTCGMCGEDIVIPKNQIPDFGIEIDGHQKVTDDDSLPFQGERLVLGENEIEKADDKLFRRIFYVCIALLAMRVTWYAIDPYQTREKERIAIEKYAEQQKLDVIRAQVDKDVERRFREAEPKINARYQQLLRNGR